jgi:hypothetical protein
MIEVPVLQDFVLSEIDDQVWKTNFQCINICCFITLQSACKLIKTGEMGTYGLETRGFKTIFYKFKVYI